MSVPVPDLPLVFDCRFALELGKFRLDVNLQSSSQVVGIFGVSGAGKSSILHAIAGIHTPVSGRIAVGGEVWFERANGADGTAQRAFIHRLLNRHAPRTNLAMQKRRVGLVFQDAQLFPHKSVKDNLLFGYRHIKAHERQFHFDEIVSLLKLEHLVNRMPSKLSGGEKQRVALGRALLYSPKVLLLDEPLSALDSQHKQEILPFFGSIISTTSIPMLYVSHDKAEIESLSDEIYYL